MIKILEKEFFYHPWYLKWYFYRHPDQKTPVFPGEFFIEGYSDIEYIAYKLSKIPQTQTVKVTILEGWNIYDIDDCLVTCIE